MQFYMYLKNKRVNEKFRKQRIKKFARQLRQNSTKAEIRLWSLLRCKQILGVQFYRQKPIGNFIVDFCAPSIKLIIELDGGQHFEEKHTDRDKRRDQVLKYNGYKILRFNNSEMRFELENVLECIYNTIDAMKSEQLSLW